MGIQDDYFDMTAWLEENAPKEIQETFEEFWTLYCAMEKRYIQMDEDMHAVREFFRVAKRNHFLS